MLMTILLYVLTKYFFSETIIDHDIGAQETCHMLLKLPLVVCSRKFFPLNVGQKVFKKVSRNKLDLSSENGFVQVYQNRPAFLEGLSMIDTTRSWNFSSKRKKEQWKPRDAPAVLRIWPRFYCVPDENSDEFETFCWSELLLYKPFRNVERDIGLSREIIVENWRNLQYRPWHLRRAPVPSNNDDDENDGEDDISHQHPVNDDENFEEWQLLSRLVPTNNLSVYDLHTLGHRDFDLSFNWDEAIVDNGFVEKVVEFVKDVQRQGVILNDAPSTFASPSSLSTKQRLAFDIVLHHATQNEHSDPLRMIIQGTAGIGKLFLIESISHAPSTSTATQETQQGRSYGINLTLL